MYSLFAMMTVAVFFGWAQHGMERQGAGSWHKVPMLSVLR
jgi:hypothetical protein